MHRKIVAPTGNTLHCKGWLQEAAMRMLMNNLDPDVAENPSELVVYGGSGKAARNWQAYDRIISALKELSDDQTLLIQSGKPVGVFKSHADAPRVLLVNSMLVPAWANWETFWELETAGLTMYGQMTAGSWIYIGTQGILQGTYETFIAAAKQHFGTDTLAGRFVLSAGLGGMGGAQPLAATMAGGVFLGIDVDRDRINKRLANGYLQVVANSLSDALEQIDVAVAKRRALSIGLVGNAADVFSTLVEMGRVPDLVTDQTSAHDMLNGYVPAGIDFEQAVELRQHDRAKYLELSGQTVVKHVQAMLDFQAAGAHVFDYGNNIRQQAHDRGLQNAFDFPGFVPAYIRPLFCSGKGPFRWVALSGDPDDIYKTDAIVKRVLPTHTALHRWLDLARQHVRFQGLPARICWLGYGEREKVGLAFNEAVRNGELSAPIVIGRDHLDCGSVASPNRETEGMKDGSDAIADWPILNAMLNAVGGATWVSVHHGGGVGIGYSIHAGMVIVADGSHAADRRLSRVLTTDPGMGVIRHFDAGYDEAIEFADKAGIKIP